MMKMVAPPTSTFTGTEDTALGYTLQFDGAGGVYMSKGASSLCTIAKSIFIGYSFRRTSAAQVLFFLV